jgi:hypothetical protein
LLDDLAKYRPETGNRTAEKQTRARMIRRVRVMRTHGIKREHCGTAMPGGAFLKKQMLIIFLLCFV